MDLTRLLQSFLDWLLAFWEAVTEWFLGLIQDVIQWAYSGLLEALASLIEALPVPDFLVSAGSVFSNIPPGVVYLVSVGQFEWGLSVIGSAYLIRFLIRRIPVIG
ncbi:hypothetical protein L0E83_16420 [Marichromatium gracile]|uniref:hypothetical protein n=1 Tax=Marichromatium TaxID=85076 RepID=UPI0011CEBC91|nr:MULTISPECIES: hypothetical protein [Marichromatium]MCF1185018.1 hypothetical protein [Marichromatium gracile]